MQQHDLSAVISRAALQGKAEIGMQALDLFVSLYGAEAGNLALNVMGMGGVFMGGSRRPDRGLRFDH